MSISQKRSVKRWKVDLKWKEKREGSGTQLHTPTIYHQRVIFILFKNKLINKIRYEEGSR